jgi:glyoxylase-like metal-dependent hydrolase (beta-lactamase superfamily II)
MAMAALPEKLAPGVYRVDALAIPYAISVLLIADTDGWTLVDTEIAGSERRIQAALTRLGAGPAELRRIYLTHQHGDHVLGLPGMRAWAPRVEVVAPEHEAEVISGRLPLDPSSSALLRRLQRGQELPASPVDRVVREGDTIAGFRIIATPGHTLGHTSLFSDRHGLLFTADAFGNLPPRPRVGVMKAFCADPARAKRSAEKLLGFDFATAVPSHGGVLLDNAKQRLRAATAACDWA